MWSWLTLTEDELFHAVFGVVGGSQGLQRIS